MKSLNPPFRMINLFFSYFVLFLKTCSGFSMKCIFYYSSARVILMIKCAKHVKFNLLIDR